MVFSGIICLNFYNKIFKFMKYLLSCNYVKNIYIFVEIFYCNFCVVVWKSSCGDDGCLSCKVFFEGVIGCIVYVEFVFCLVC